MWADKIDASITFLKTRDMDKTTEFYIDSLGFHLVLDQGKCKIFHAGSSAYLGFCQTDGETGSSEVILTFVLDDVDEACSHMEKAGIQIEVRPRYNPQYHIYQFFIRDPNGYLLEIQRFCDPAWKEPVA
jgi:catechol 2,3-dioxygenase-like lactoylglutathione lyase family enzyme